VENKSLKAPGENGGGPGGGRKKSLGGDPEGHGGNNTRPREGWESREKYRKSNEGKGKKKNRSSTKNTRRRIKFRNIGPIGQEGKGG